MKYKNIPFAFLVLLALFVLIYSAGKINFRSKTESKDQKDAPISDNIPTHPLKFYDEESFNQAYEKVKKESKPLSYQVRGGIIPHHLYPSYVIADFFKNLSQQKPKTVILIGPNHYERGDFKALASLYGWQTPFGTVYPYEEIIYELLEKNLIKINEEVVSEDHSASGIIPFLKFYLPDAKVVPILLSVNLSQEDSQVLADNLMKHLNKDTVLIAAVDFSHKLNNLEAQKKDEITLKLMQNYDYQKLLTLDNEYLDSPPSITVLLMTMKGLQVTGMDILHHTNSGQMQRNNSIETTSYFSIAYF